MTTPQPSDDTAGERLSWALVAAIARDDEEGYRLLEQNADETTIRAALRFTVGGAIGSLLRATIAENPGTSLDRDTDHILTAIATAASRQALEAAREGS